MTMFIKYLYRYKLLYQWAGIYIYIYIYMCVCVCVCMCVCVCVLHLKETFSTVVDGDEKAPFSIDTTPRCRGGRYSFS